MIDKFSQVAENLPAADRDADRQYHVINGYPVVFSFSKEPNPEAFERMDKVSRLYDELISYADLYDSANFEAKKMIVNQLIRRVDVYRGYQINISFNFDLTPYIEGE